MAATKIKIYVLLKHYQKQNYKAAAAAAAQKTCEKEVNGVVNEQISLALLSNWNMNIKNLPPSTRSAVWDIENTRRVCINQLGASGFFKAYSTQLYQNSQTVL